MEVKGSVEVCVPSSVCISALYLVIKVSLSVSLCPSLTLAVPPLSLSLSPSIPILPVLSHSLLTLARMSDTEQAAEGERCGSLCVHLQMRRRRRSRRSDSPTGPCGAVVLLRPRSPRPTETRY